MLNQLLAALISAAIVAAAAPRADAGDVYRKANSAELPFRFSSALKYIEADAHGNTVAVDGNVKEFSLGGKQIELETKKLTKIGTGIFILTKRYGKVKVTFESNLAATLWVTPSQAEQFKALRKDTQ